MEVAPGFQPSRDIRTSLCSTEVRELGAFLRERFVVEFLRLLGVEAEVELIGPAELESRLA